MMNSTQTMAKMLPQSLLVPTPKPNDNVNQKTGVASPPSSCGCCKTVYYDNPIADCAYLADGSFACKRAFPK